MAWYDGSVFRIESRDSKSRVQGTGFACGQDKSGTYVITCWHVVKAIGRDHLRIGDKSCTLVSEDGDDQLDLAVLRFDGAPGGRLLPLDRGGARDMPFETYGYEPVGRPLSGDLGADTKRPHPSDNDVPAWDYYLSDGTRQLERIKDGYSGAPVYDPQTGHVVAVITHRKGDDKGFAIDLSNLSRVYQQAGRWFTETDPVTGNLDSDTLGEYGEPGEVLAKTLDHEEQLAKIKQWFETSRSGRGVALVEACADDCADYLADHICLEEDLGDCSGSSGRPPEATQVQVNPLYEHRAFWKGLIDTIPGLDDRANGADQRAGIHGFLQRAPVHVFYVPVVLEQHGRRLPAMLRGAHQTLMELGDLAPGARLLVLFAAIADRRLPFWWRWYRLWTIDRLECCHFIGRLRPLRRTDIVVWHAGISQTLQGLYKCNELQRSLKDLFAGGQTEIRYEQISDHLLSYGDQPGAIALARRTDPTKPDRPQRGNHR